MDSSSSSSSSDRSSAPVVEPNKADSADWRSQWQAGSRQRIVNKIMDCLKRQLPIWGPEGLLELEKIFMRYEAKIYTSAISQSEYLRQISLKTLTMESNFQNTGLTNSLPLNSVLSNQNLRNPDSKSQTCHANTADWREEAFQKIITMKEMYLQELNGMYQKIIQKIQQQEILTQQLKEEIKRLKVMLVFLERIVSFLQVPKANIPPSYRDKMALIDSTSQIGHANTTDWQEETFHKIKAMKEIYIQDLKELHEQIIQKLPQQDFLIQQLKEQIGRLEMLQVFLEWVVSFLQVPKDNIPPGYKDKLGYYEDQIIAFLNSYRGKKPNPSLQASIDLTSQTGHANTADWQEEAFQKIKAMKEMYLQDLIEKHKKITQMLQQTDLCRKDRVGDG